MEQLVSHIAALDYITVTVGRGSTYTAFYNWLRLRL